MADRHRAYYTQYPLHPTDLNLHHADDQNVTVNHIAPYQTQAAQPQPVAYAPIYPLQATHAATRLQNNNPWGPPYAEAALPLLPAQPVASGYAQGGPGSYRIPPEPILAGSAYERQPVNEVLEYRSDPPATRLRRRRDLHDIGSSRSRPDLLYTPNLHQTQANYRVQVARSPIVEEEEIIIREREKDTEYTEYAKPRVEEDREPSSSSDWESMRETVRLTRGSAAPKRKEGTNAVRRTTQYAYRNVDGRLLTTNSARAYRRNALRDSFYDDYGRGTSSVTLVGHQDENGTLRSHTLKVSSPSFLSLLRDLGKYALHSPDEQGVGSFAEPFVDIFCRRDALRQFLEDSARVSVHGHPSLYEKTVCTQAVLGLLESDFAALTRTFDSFRSPNPPSTISFANLWMIYQPGSLVFAQLEGQAPFALMVDSIEHTKLAFGIEIDGPNVPGTIKLYCWFLDFHTVNGQYDGKFGRRGYVATVKPFEGEMPLSKLQYVPEGIYKSEDIKNQLKDSGRNFWQLSGPSYREVRRLDKFGRRTLDRERIMIDPTTYKPRVEHKLTYSDDVDNASHVAVVFGGTEDIRGNAYKGEAYQDDTPRGFSASWFNEYDTIDPSAGPTDLMLLLCPSIVPAFSLRDKAWAKYRVAELEPVQFHEDAWSRLVIDQQYKDVVQAMVNTHLRQSDRFDDLVPGKGGGVVMLLHGPPGVGKTLTAESVAENANKPLYMVTAGDLGTNPEQLESKLSTIFELASKWDAILLLDEADVFLQDRDYENLTRNALVSIFLRTLEYFKGIMFLTSNRVGSFDQAFQSRIHITLGIPEFNEAVRKEVWKIFITDLGRRRRDGSDPVLTIDECKALGREIITSWAREPLNGRQIRNCVRSALALAQDKGETLAAKHFNTVIELGNTFTQYLRKLQKLESDELAQVKGDRLAEMRSLVMQCSQPNGVIETHGSNGS